MSSIRQKHNKHLKECKCVYNKKNPTGIGNHGEYYIGNVYYYLKNEYGDYVVISFIESSDGDIFSEKEFNLYFKKLDLHEIRNDKITKILK